MISEGTNVKVVDNSGALEGRCIRVIRPRSGEGRRIGREGDVIVLTVTKTATVGTIKKGDVVKGLIVRAVKVSRGVSSIKKEEEKVVTGKKSGIGGVRVRYEENSVILVKMGQTGAGEVMKNKSEVAPIATRAKGPISGVIRMSKNNSKVIAIVD